MKGHVVAVRAGMSDFIEAPEEEKAQSRYDETDSRYCARYPEASGDPAALEPVDDNEPHTHKSHRTDEENV